MSILVPTGNKSQIGVTNTGLAPENFRYVAHIPIRGNSAPEPLTKKILDIKEDSVPVSPFASLSAYDLQNSDLPCVGVNRDAGTVLSKVKHPNVIPALAGAYPQPVGGRDKNIGLNHTAGMIKSINQPILRNPSNFNAFQPSSFKGVGR
jgi:hypothetical protein